MIKFRLNALNMLLPTNPNDVITLVSGLQTLLVQEEFYSMKKCTTIGLLGVPLLLSSVTGIQHTLKRQTENRKQNVTVGILLLS